MDTLRTSDGLALHRRHWPARTDAVRGTLHLVHGLGEHAGRYEAVAQRLAAAGFDVHAHDHRGHGRSEGPRGALPRPDALLADLAAVIDATPARGPRLLLGHSMGGAVAARFVAEAVAPAPAAWSRPVDALVLSSPALDAGLGPAQRALLALLGPLAPGLAVGNGLKPDWVSRDAEVVRAYLADPLVHDRITPALVRFIVEAGTTARDTAPRWRVPTLLMWAGADRCVAPAGSAAFAAAAPAGVVTAQPYPGLFHEILNEPEHEQVLADLLRWLDRTVPAGSVAA